MPFCPLGRGFLTGAVKRAEAYPQDDWRRNDPRYQGENFDANVRATSAVQAVAKTVGATPAQVALAWLLEKGEDIVPIPGTKRRAHLEENMAAASVRLDASQMMQLDAAMRPGTIAGPRYSEKVMAIIDR